MSNPKIICGFKGHKENVIFKTEKEATLDITIHERDSVTCNIRELMHRHYNHRYAEYQVNINSLLELVYNNPHLFVQLAVKTLEVENLKKEMKEILLEPQLKPSKYKKLKTALEKWYKK